MKWTFSSLTTCPKSNNDWVHLTVVIDHLSILNISTMSGFSQHLLVHFTIGSKTKQMEQSNLCWKLCFSEKVKIPYITLGEQCI